MSENSIHLSVDQQVTFAEDPNPFTVQAVSGDGRWVAATRAWCQWDVDKAYETGDAELFDQDLMGGWPKIGDPIYTVIDLALGLRGGDNAVGSLGYETREQCAEAIRLFESGQFEHSRRNPPIDLHIAEVAGV